MAAKEWSHLLVAEQAVHFARAKLLILKPDFSVPEEFPNQRIDTVRVDKPDGSSFEASAQFNISHININSPEPMPDERWRLTVSLVDVSPEHVPVGSNVFASPELVAKIRKKAKFPS